MSLDQRRLPDMNDLRDWARETLNLPADLTSTGTRVAILERLAQCEFVPGEDWNDSIDALVPSASEVNCTVPTAYYVNREKLMWTNLAQFARKFFALHPEQRLAEWQQIHSLSGPWPPIRVCLTNLQPALSADLTCLRGSSDELCNFGYYLSRRFVQWAARLGMEHWEKQLNNVANTDFKPRTAKRFKQRFPELTQIFAPWIDEILRPKATWTTSYSRRIDDFSDKPSESTERVLRFVLVASGLFAAYWYLKPLISGPELPQQNAVQPSAQDLEILQRLVEKHQQ